MLRLHIANKNYSSWSLRPWILLQELEIPFEERLTPFGDGNGTSSFAAFSPSGRVPCLVHEELTVWDSLAIIEYLAEVNPRVWPIQRERKAWSRCVAAEMHSGFSHVRNICGMNCGLRIRLHEWPAPLLAEWRRIDEIWCEGIARFDGPFLAGTHFSAADAFFAPVAFRVQTYSPRLSPDAQAYARRLLELPHMVDWYESALQETWRDEAHDQEARTVGTVIQDLRTGGTN
jgi:glutathione S-transferase